MTGEVQYRRYLPHWYVPGAAHFVTYRLAGTIPAAVIERMRKERCARLAKRPSRGTAYRAFRANIHKQFFAKYDDILDQSKHIQWLADPRIAKMIRENLYHHDGSKYRLLSYCILSNHVHVVLLPLDSSRSPGGSPGIKLSKLLPREEYRTDKQNDPGEPPGLRDDDELFSDEIADSRSPLANIMHSLKSYTAHEANKILGRTGRFWQPESYDHWVRDEEELERIVTYVAHNPMKAGVAREPHKFEWCSAHDRYERDGTRSSWLLDELP